MPKAILLCTYIFSETPARLDEDGILVPPEHRQVEPGTLIEISQTGFDALFDPDGFIGLRSPTDEEAAGPAVAVIY